MGLDPGLAITGYGLVRESPTDPLSSDASRPDASWRSGAGGDLSLVEYGTVNTPAGQALPDRLLTISDKLGALIARHQPDIVAVEELFFGRNVTTAFMVGQARGVAILAVARAGIPVREYKPVVVKQAIAGYGRAPKSQMQEMVRMLLGLDHVPRPDDAADAVAVAICHVYRARLEKLIGHLDGAGEGS